MTTSNVDVITVPPGLQPVTTSAATSAQAERERRLFTASLVAL
jgi:hypothetical protein